jgi:hypothetical protein
LAESEAEEEEEEEEDGDGDGDGDGGDMVFFSPFVIVSLVYINPT